MPKIICVNEKGKVYATPEDLEKIVHYVYNPLKTTEDVLRPGHGIGDYTGCFPFMGPEYLSHDETAKYRHICLQITQYTGNLMGI